jgi:hypothetical protein
VNVTSVDDVVLSESRRGRRVTVPVARPRRWNTRHQLSATNMSLNPKTIPRKGTGPLPKTLGTRIGPPLWLDRAGPAIG